MRYITGSLALAAALVTTAALVISAEETPPWRHVTQRLQEQIDECRHDSRDLSIIERRLSDAEARILFLEEQVKLLTEGDTNAARLMRRWEAEMGEVGKRMSIQTIIVIVLVVLLTLIILASPVTSC
jgi:hypothetical protein